jgi:hypothetical protein
MLYALLANIVTINGPGDGELGEGRIRRGIDWRGKDWKGIL